MTQTKETKATQSFQRKETKLISSQSRTTRLPRRLPSHPICTLLMKLFWIQFKGIVKFGKSGNKKRIRLVKDDSSFCDGFVSREILVFVLKPHNFCFFETKPHFAHLARPLFSVSLFSPPFLGPPPELPISFPFSSFSHHYPTLASHRFLFQKTF